MIYRLHRIICMFSVVGLVGSLLVFLYPLFLPWHLLAQPNHGCSIPGYLLYILGISFSVLLLTYLVNGCPKCRCLEWCGKKECNCGYRLQGDPIIGEYGPY